MFNKTRKQLTLLFSGLLMIFLLSFLFITYFWLNTSIVNEQKEGVKALAIEELDEHKENIIEWYDEERDDDDDDDEREQEHEEDDTEEEKMFYYIVSHDGTIIEADITMPSLQKPIYDALKGWKPKNLEVKYENIIDDNGNKLKVLLAGISVYEENEYLGTVYTGTNVTSQQKVINELLRNSILLSIFFLFLSSVLGYYMAGKAMIPISRSFKRQREFVSDASHELRTPLSILLSSIEVIEKEEKDKISEFSLQVLDDMKDETKRMTKLVGDLLTLARSDSGTLELKKETFDLSTSMTKLVRSFQPLVDEHEIEFILSIPDDVTIHADEERITQLIFILIDNAIKYNVQHGKIYVNLIKQQANIEIEIKDTGIGIPPDQLNRIFDRFYRVDKARSREHGGNGIGLSIAQWIVEAHNGTINVTSEIQKGTAFKISFPTHHKN